MITAQDLGGPTAVARMLGLSVPTVHGWKAIPAHHCPALELATDGKFVVEAMTPSAPWTRVPDKNWPHPDGRPVLDFALDAKPQVPHVAPLVGEGV